MQQQRHHHRQRPARVHSGRFSSAAAGGSAVVVPTHIVTNWTVPRMMVLLACTLCMSCLSILPMIILESNYGSSMLSRSGVTGGHHMSMSVNRKRDVVSVHQLMDVARNLKQKVLLYRRNGNHNNLLRRRPEGAAGAAAAGGGAAVVSDADTTLTEDAGAAAKDAMMAKVPMTEEDIEKKKKKIIAAAAAVAGSDSVPVVEKTTSHSIGGGDDNTKKKILDYVPAVQKTISRVVANHHHNTTAKTSMIKSQPSNKANVPIKVPIAAAATEEEKEKDRIMATKNKKKIIKSPNNITLSDLQQDIGWSDKPVRRGVAGRPADMTPAVKDARRAHVECDVNVDSIAYWNDPAGTFDETFVSPFAVDAADNDEKYISFAPDRGGWNNVRMSMEIIFVVAAATGRTLVLPPKEPLYLLNKDTAGSKHRGFGDFFPIQTARFQKRVKVVSFAEFLSKEGAPGKELAVPAENRTKVQAAADNCDKRKVATNFCDPVMDYLRSVSFNAPVKATDHCFVFDVDMYHGMSEPSTAAAKQRIDTVCGAKRTKVYFTKDVWQRHKLIHFRTAERDFRLLTHHYGMIHFSNATVDNFYKRFVRDFLHYHDGITCAAGKIVKAVQAEGAQRGFVPDGEGAGAYSALHVRRGDLQYKKVKIPAAEWYANTRELWRPNEILYVATDERNKTFFRDLAAHHDLRFLDDYWTLANLSVLDPNYMGMIDTIVASRGRAFAGTYFSTFTGYINRLRGYHGMSMMDSWYGWLPKKDAVHNWTLQNEYAYAYEWPDGWIGIDANVWPNRDDKF